MKGQVRRIRGVLSIILCLQFCWNFRSLYNQNTKQKMNDAAEADGT